jgi:hypothetical protein
MRPNVLERDRAAFDLVTAPATFAFGSAKLLAFKTVPAIAPSFRCYREIDLRHIGKGKRPLTRHSPHVPGNDSYEQLRIAFQ